MYDSVIVELLLRIQKLEKEVELLKQANVSLPAEQSDKDTETTEKNNNMQRSYKKMTDEMLEACYEYGKRASNGENLQELAAEIAEKTDMNRNSAIMYLYAVCGMLEGMIYKRAISAKAVQVYFNKIFKEYGNAGLKKAIRATRLHVDYRRECGQKVDSLEELCKKNEAKL